MKIHPTAIISPKAVLEDDVEIGPYSIVSDDVTIGKGTVVGPHVVIEGPTRIGENCRFFQFCSIGAIPQDLKFKGEDSPLIIGNGNTFRECVTVHRGTAADINMTSIGNDNFLMAYCHVAHNCKLDDNIIMSNAVNLAGHIHVEDYAIIGGMTGIHQFTRIGCHCMVSGASGVAQDVIPYVTAAGNHAKLYGLNVVGLKRRGFSEEAISALKKTYRILFRSNMLLSDALAKIRDEAGDFPEVRHVVEFIEASKRGICR